MPVSSIVQHESSGEHGPRRITTAETMAKDLRGALLQRGIPRGCTLGDFFDALLKTGAQLDEPLGSIDVGNGQFSTGVLVIERGEDGLEVREVR